MSRPRVDDRFIRTLTASAGCALLIGVALAFTGGGSLTLAGVEVRAHNPLRPVLAGFLFALLALVRGGGEAVTSALEWHWRLLERAAACIGATLAIAAVAAGFHWGAFIAGGSDSYCYLNQAELLARGAVHDYEPLSADPSWPGNAWSFAPAGHIPMGVTNPALVPICPAGYPLIMAAARRAAGRGAMFWITPIMGGLAVGLAFLLGRRLGGPMAGVLAAAATLASPTFLMQLFQPMNDVTAAAAWVAALVVAMRDGRRDRARAAAAGLLSAAALTVRPNLVPLALVVGFGLALLPEKRSVGQRLTMIAIFGLATVPGVALVMAIQHAMYGSPFKSGYGDLGEMFAAPHLLPNLRRYPRWLIEAHTPLIVAAGLGPWLLSTQAARRRAICVLAFAAATLACYLPYVVFDAWWYTRFLLPTILPVLALMAAVVVAVIARAPAAARPIVFVLLTCTLAALSIRAAIPRDVFRMRGLEWRFRSAGERVAALPGNAALITLHHSGSARFYAGRSTHGWADIERGRLDDAVAFLRRHDRKPYLLFEPWEEPQFKERFAGERLGGLDWPPLAEVDGVRIYDPDDRDRHLRGDTVSTERIVTSRK